MFFSKFVNGNVINAGDGANEHPTQALLDAFTILEQKGKIEGLNIVILGDILHSRVARSNIYLLNKLGANITLVGPTTLVPKEFEAMGVKVTNNLDSVIENADVINVLRIQLERLKKGLFPSVREYSRFFGLDDKRLQLAKYIGASYVINSKTENVHARLEEITEGYGADVVIEAVGSPATYVMAVDEVAFTGRVICIGYSKTDVSFQTKLFVQKELDIRGSRNALPADFRAVIKYLRNGICPVDELITKEVKPEGGLDAMKEWAANPGKVFRILVKFN